MIAKREGEGGMIWESSIETCRLPYVKEMTSPSSMYVLEAGALGQPWGMGWGERSEGI